MDIPANRLFVWENDENIVFSIQNRGNRIAVGEITPYEMEWISDVLYFSGYTIGTEEGFNGNYNPSIDAIELHPVTDDSILFAMVLMAYSQKPVSSETDGAFTTKIRHLSWGNPFLI